MAHGRHWPGDVQLEYCEICGVRLPAAERIQATTQDLAGRWACPKCAPLVLNPSYLDFGGPGNLAPEPGEVEPHSGEDWVTSIQGETTYSQFYAGAATGEIPATSVSIDPPSKNVRMIPLALPRRLSSNTLESVSVTVDALGGAGNRQLDVAIYQKSLRDIRPGTLVKALGSKLFPETFSGALEFQADLFLNGDRLYYLAFFMNAICTGNGFLVAQTDGTLGTDTEILSPRLWWNGVSAWPHSGIRTIWTQRSVNFPAFLMKMES